MFAVQRYTPIRTSLTVGVDPWFDRLPLLHSDIVDGHWTLGYGAINLYETDDALTVEMTAPGFRPDDISVHEQQGVLTICGNQRAERRGKQDGVSFEAQRVHFVNRKVRLPCDVDTDRSEATLRDGVLTIKLPKAQSSRAHRIVIQPSQQSITVRQDHRSLLDRFAAWWRRRRTTEKAA